jgi:hypothetical protein
MKSYFKICNNFLSFITGRKVGLYKVKECDTRVIQQIPLSITVSVHAVYMLYTAHMLYTVYDSI